jgi:hypothetical protein
MLSNEAVLWLPAQVTLIRGFAGMNLSKIFIDVILYTFQDKQGFLKKHVMISLA